MPIVDPQGLWPKLDAMGVEQVRSKLASGAFGSWKRPLVEEWLRRAEQLPTPDTFMYHPVEAPSGRLFHASQVKSLESVGWLDRSSQVPCIEAQELPFSNQGVVGGVGMVS